MITIKRVKEWNPCHRYTDERLRELFAGREQLSVEDVAALDIPKQDKTWALLQLLDDRDQRLFACWCVRNTPVADGHVVWDLLTDERSRNAVRVAERYADGRATSDELSAAGDAAWAAAGAAAGDAAWAAAGAAAWDAAGAAARAAAWDAARAAAWDAAWAAAGAAAWAAARAAAGNAAWDAAGNAAEAAQLARLVEIAKAKGEK